MAPAKTVCFLDFDHTLFHTDQFFHVDVRNAFLDLGIDAADWEQSYAAVWPTGYLLEKHVEEVYRRSGKQLPLEQMKSVLRRSFSDLRRYLFPDVLPFLRRAKKSGVLLCLLSFGHEQWQRYKLLACDLDGYFDDVFFTANAGGKAKLVERAKEMAQTAVAVDNDPHELDLIKDLAPQVRTYCIRRVPAGLVFPTDEFSRLRFLEARGYLERVARHPHTPCTSLDGLLGEKKPALRKKSGAAREPQATHPGLRLKPS